VRQRLAYLPPCEHEVPDLAVTGLVVKQIAAGIGTAGENHQDAPGSPDAKDTDALNARPRTDDAHGWPIAPAVAASPRRVSRSICANSGACAQRGRTRSIRASIGPIRNSYSLKGALAIFRGRTPRALHGRVRDPQLVPPVRSSVLNRSHKNCRCRAISNSPPVCTFAHRRAHCDSRTLSFLVDDRQGRYPPSPSRELK
jgi:hypothetical protein